MLNEVCAYLRNWFDRNQPKTLGDITIENRKLLTDCNLKENQYFRIVDSTFNDGIYKNNNDLQLIDETFNGAVWAMAIPPDFIKLVEDINRFNAKVEEMCLMEKGYASESFGGYSYTLSSSAPAGMVAWEKRINQQLNRWRKI